MSLNFLGNHLGIFKSCGYSNVKQYRYWDAQNRTIDFNGMMEDLNVCSVIHVKFGTKLFYIIFLKLVN